jgi:hypothetical protein
MSVKRSTIGVLLGICAVVMLWTPSAASATPSEQHPFEIVPGSFQFAPSSYQAGAHADWSVAFDFAHEQGGIGATYNDARTVSVEFPPGFDASNTAAPTCTFEQLISGNEQLPACPVASQVGLISVEVANPSGGLPGQFTVPLFNMETTSFGVTAEVGYKTVLFTEVMQVHPSSGSDQLIGAGPDIPKTEPHKIHIVLWGLPAAHENDAQRGETCGEDFELPPLCVHSKGGGGPQTADIPVKPFLSNPTSCGMFTANMEADSWEQPLTWLSASDEVGPIVECERVPFEPEITAAPSTRSAESPTGLEVSLNVPQTWENPYSISTANLKDARVTLPEGMTANPGLAEGLAACTPPQYATETSSSLPGEGCPAESKIGSILIETPLLAEPISGAIYIATPYDNPFPEPGHPNGSLLALYVVAKDPQKGILIKVAGKITPNPVTGQLVTTFDENPQQPFSKFILKFRPGAAAPLISPPSCGDYALQAELTPWSALSEAHLISSEPFEITQGVHEGPCPSGGVPPFKPQVISGTENNAGGSYSPFYLRILREDGEQELVKFSTTLPPGLTGNLTGVEKCPDADIEAARQMSGAEEEAQPSCPAGSEIGHTLVEAGVGTVLAQNPGKVYLAGPYHGAPLSIVSITSAKVGPFDLGTVVLRFALDINPITAQVEVSGAQSDPIPRIINGIVVHVRDIRVYMDRPKFILNPTNCEALHIGNAIVGADPTNQADQDTNEVSTRFEAADCASLSFKPQLTVSTSSKTSRRFGATLHVRLAYPKAPQGTQSNIREVKVELPPQLPARQETLKQACPVKVFEANPAACAPGSRVGSATALTPILPVPLTGPAYFVSYGGAQFPELVVVLQGYGFTIDLHGETFINEKTSVISSSFKTVPDQPVESFELNLPQGQYSALAANGNLCTQTLSMPTTFIAQNGAQIEQSTGVAVEGCKPTLAILRHKVKRDSVSVTVRAPAAGRLTASGQGLSGASRKVSGAGPVTLSLRLSTHDRRLLAHKPGRELKVTVTLRFTPKHGQGQAVAGRLSVLMR